MVLFQVARVSLWKRIWQKTRTLLATQLRIGMRSQTYLDRRSQTLSRLDLASLGEPGGVVLVLPLHLLVLKATV
jgi:hypothetical protein